MRHRVGAGDVHRFEILVVVVGIDEEDALAVLTELREGPALGDALGPRALVERKDVNAWIGPPQRGGEKAVRTFAISYHPAVRRKGGLTVIARLRRNGASDAAVRPDDLDLAAL